MVADARAYFPVLQYFEYDHLPRALQLRSIPFYDLAWGLAQAWVDSGRADPADAGADEVRVGLRKLLEAKDCFVRSALI